MHLIALIEKCGSDFTANVIFKQKPLCNTIRVFAASLVFFINKLKERRSLSFTDVQFQAYFFKNNNVTRFYHN